MGTLRDLQFALQLKIEELRQRDTLIDELELELDMKDELIRRLQEELDRYRATVSPAGASAAGTACMAQRKEKQRSNGKTVISEPFTLDLMTLTMVSHRSCDKSEESQRLIRAAFSKNDLLRNLDEEEIRAIIACMYPTSVSQGGCVIQEGTSGAEAYVLEEGKLDVTKDGLKLHTLDPEDVFGELALLYSCTQNYSVSAQTDSKLWVIDRRSYQNVLVQSGLSSISHSTELLNSIPFLQSLPEDVIMKMSDLMEEANYAEGDYITRQGATGDTLYIISKGQVKLTEKKVSHEEQIVLSTLSERQWFGEKALWGLPSQPCYKAAGEVPQDGTQEDVWTVNAIAAGEVTCLVIDRETFQDVIDGVAFDCDHEVQQSYESKTDKAMEPDLLSSSTLSDFQIICTLAIGEFGHVDLVQLKSSISVFAMKVLKKKLIHREHILRESHILLEACCPFIVRLYKTFRDTKCLYMLSEACVGGDLCSLLKDKGHLDECSTRFYTACIVEALIFLHSRCVIYRDIKPENVVLDEHGYAKLIGSRCLQRVDVGKKTWTFCGTPAYMAPEIILNKGCNASADFWSLGVFVFELLSDQLPFGGTDPLTSLTATIWGIDHIDFPKTISKSASSLIKKLCRSNPSDRLGSRRNGAKDIQKHIWFEGFNWGGLCKHTLNPPFIPRVKNLLDSGTCDHYSEGSVELNTAWDDF